MYDHPVPRTDHHRPMEHDSIHRDQVCLEIFVGRQFLNSWPEIPNSNSRAMLRSAQTRGGIAKRCNHRNLNGSINLRRRNGPSADRREKSKRKTKKFMSEKLQKIYCPLLGEMSRSISIQKTREEIRIIDWVFSQITSHLPSPIEPAQTTKNLQSVDARAGAVL